MSGKRRWLEWGKDAVIVLLAISAAYLLTKTPLVQDSGFLPQGETAQTVEKNDTVTLTSAAYPSRLSVRVEQGRYAVQYDQAQVDSLFAGMGPLLGEALVSAGQPEQITEGQWQRYLQGLSIYFDFSGEIPLSALGSWIQGERTCELEDSARRIVLAAGVGDEVLLSYQAQDGNFYVCETRLSKSLHLSPAVEGIEENGALFAFESDQMEAFLDPYTLLTEETGGTVYTAVTPISASSDLTQLLENLSFNGQNHTSISGGEAFLEGENRLEIQNNGTVIYRAGQQGKYEVAHSGSEPTLAEMIETVRKLAEDTVGSLCGEARLHLISAQETAEGWQIQFGYQLNGSSVWLYQDGWAAQFLVRDGTVSEFTLHFRSYTATEEQALMLPVYRAAVMLPGLTEEQLELVVQYRDQGDAEISPIWVAQ